METDASDFAIAAILSQLDKDGIWKPIAFMSKSWNEAERNYEIYDKEMLAVMQGFYEWSHYLRGYNAEIEVLTDHQNLTYFRKPQNFNRRQARWILDLQEYNFTIKHQSGKSNTKADLLSRRANYPRGENDNQGVTLLKTEHFRNVKIRLSEDTVDWIYLMDEIRKTHRRFYDKQVDHAIKTCMDMEGKNLCPSCPKTTGMGGWTQTSLYDSRTPWCRQNPQVDHQRILVAKYEERH